MESVCATGGSGVGEGWAGKSGAKCVREHFLICMIVHGSHSFPWEGKKAATLEMVQQLPKLSHRGTTQLLLYALPQMKTYTGGSLCLDVYNSIG